MNRRGSLRSRTTSAVLVLALLLVAPDAMAGGPTPSTSPSGLNSGGAQGAGISAQILPGWPIKLPQDGTILVQTFLVATAGSINTLKLIDPFLQTLVNDASHTATVETVGTFLKDTELVFGLHSSFTGETYLSTESHAKVMTVRTGEWLIGWEDWADSSYDDVLMLVCYQGPLPAPRIGCELPPGLSYGDPNTLDGPIIWSPDPVNTATGNYTTAVTDAALPGRGLPFAFERTYNSLDTGSASLGQGWRHSFEPSLTVEADGSVTSIAEDGAQATYTPNGAGGFLRPPGSTSVLAPVQGGGYDLTEKDQVRSRFDATGRLQSLTDRNGNAINLGYVAGKLSTITDTVGRAYSLGYDPQGRLASLTFPVGRTTTYEYDPNGRLWKVTDAESGITTYTYDAQGRLATIVDQENRQIVANTYGANGRVIEQIDPRGKHTVFDWDAATEVSTRTDPLGGEWIEDYDAGILKSRRDPLGNTTAYSFNSDLGLSAIVDANGRTWATIRDTFGNVLTKKYPQPLDYSETWTYNGRNDPLTHRDRRGNVTTYTYDAAGNLKTITGPPAPTSPVTTYNYDPNGTGLLTSIVDARGKTTTFGYDAQANRNRITTPLGNITTMAYDGAGRMTSIVDARGNVAGANPADYTTSFAYDKLNRQVTATTPLGHLSTFVYDKAGNKTSVTDANTHVTVYTYDAANNLVTASKGLGQTTTYGYDDGGNLISREDANHHVTTYAYDLAHRLIAETRPLGRVWTYAYSPTGMITKVVDAIASNTADPNDYQSTFAYDAMDRLTSVTHASSETITYVLDPNDNRLSMTDGAGTSTYTYDVLNRLASYSRGSRGLTYAYDAAGNVTSRTSTDGAQVLYTYDNDGRLATAASAGATTAYGYDAAGNLTSTTLPATNGYVEGRTYDPNGRLTEVKSQKGSTVLARSTYTLDPVGNRLSAQAISGTVTYTYDALDRLTQACYTATCTGGTDPFRRYTYDAVGNRLTEERSAGTTTYTYNALDELTQTTGFGGTVNYTYDRDGRTLTAGTRTFQWRNPDRMASTTQSGTTTTYTYDGDGLRFEASTGSQASKKTQFDWDPNNALPQLVAERNGSGTLLSRYVNGLDAISVSSGNKTAYFHYDGLGSVTNLTSSAGATWWTYDYFPYGGVRTATKNNNQALDNNLRFTGEYFDPTGLYYLRARAYDPASGRFTSTDPLKSAVGDPYVSTYAYARNNPVLYSDPSGQCVPLVGVAAAGTATVALALPSLALLGLCVGVTALVVAWSAEPVADTVVEVANTIDQKLGETIPQTQSPPWVRVPLPQPDLGPPTDPHTGDPGGPAPKGPMVSQALKWVLIGTYSAYFILGEGGS